MTARRPADRMSLDDVALQLQQHLVDEPVRLRTASTGIGSRRGRAGDGAAPLRLAARRALFADA